MNKTIEFIAPSEHLALLKPKILGYTLEPVGLDINGQIRPIADFSPIRVDPGDVSLSCGIPDDSQPQPDFKAFVDKIERLGRQLFPSCPGFDVPGTCFEIAITREDAFFGRTLDVLNRLRPPYLRAKEMCTEPNHSVSMFVGHREPIAPDQTIGIVRFKPVKEIPIT